MTATQRRFKIRVTGPILFGWSKQKQDGRGMQHASGEQTAHAVLWWENLKERDNLKDLNVDGKTISNYIFKNYDRWGGSMDGIDLAQDWHTCRDVMNNTVMNLRGSTKCGEFLDQLRNHQLITKDCAPASLLTLWPWSWTFTVQHIICVKFEYFMNQEG